MRLLLLPILYILINCTVQSTSVEETIPSKTVDDGVTIIQQGSDTTIDTTQDVEITLYNKDSLLAKASHTYYTITAAGDTAFYLIYMYKRGHILSEYFQINSGEISEGTTKYAITDYADSSVNIYTISNSVHKAVYHYDEDNKLYLIMNSNDSGETSEVYYSKNMVDSNMSVSADGAIKKQYFEDNLVQRGAKFTSSGELLSTTEYHYDNPIMFRNVSSKVTYNAAGDTIQNQVTTFTPEGFFSGEYILDSVGDTLSSFDLSRPYKYIYNESYREYPFAYSLVEKIIFSNGDTSYFNYYDQIDE